MKLLTKFLIALAVIVTVFGSCMRDDLDMEYFSDRFKLERTIALPLVHGNIFLKDLMDEIDSVLIIEADSVFTDTIEFDIGDKANEFELEYFKLYHNTANFLPVAADFIFVPYDSVTQRKLDTIKFIENDVYLQAAPIDAQGNAIIDQVDTIRGILNIDKQEAEDILNLATHFIFKARLISDTTTIIPIDDYKRIWLQYSFEAKGSYTSEFNNEEEN